MKLNNGETIEQAEENLEKALKAKKECSHGERYCDPAMNEALEHVEKRHADLLKSILEEITTEIERDSHAGW